MRNPRAGIKAKISEVVQIILSVSALLGLHYTRLRATDVLVLDPHIIAVPKFRTAPVAHSVFGEVVGGLARPTGLFLKGHLTNPPDELPWRLFCEL